MANAFVLGNGQLLVGLGYTGLVRDFYFPYVGLENHIVKYEQKIGLYINGKFVSFDEDGWDKQLFYQKNTLVSDIIAKHPKIPIKLQFNDLVHHKKNIFIRKVTIYNKTDKQHEIKLFFNQNFQIYGTSIGNTAYYNPIIRSVIHYKDKRYFLINGCLEKECGISSYEIAVLHPPESDSSWINAQKGTLNGNAVGHGPVDSTVSFNFVLEPNQKTHIYYWVCVGKSFKQVDELNRFIYEKTPDKLFQATKNHWARWSNKVKFEFKGLSKEVVEQFKRSLLIIRTHIDKNGSFIASADSGKYFYWQDTYNYCWPRDGALIARSLDRAGLTDLTDPFFSFCLDSLSDEGYLFHKYLPDGALGSTWHSWLHQGRLLLPIQEDETALVLDALWKHFVQYNDKEFMQKIFETRIRKIINFLLTFIDSQTGLPKQSYDIWEQKVGIHTWTAATVYAGLMAGAHFERFFGTKEYEEKCIKAAKKIKDGILKYLWDPEKGYFIKSIYYDNDELKKDTTLDSSSAYAVFHWGILPVHDERIKKSFEKYMEACKAPVGGFERFVGDTYYRTSSEKKSNVWFISTLWVAEYYIKLAKNEKDLEPAKEIFEWVISHIPTTGVMAEQINPYNGKPISVEPLSWSHAAFVIAINKYLEKLDDLGICKMCNPPALEHMDCNICEENYEATHGT